MVDAVFRSKNTDRTLFAALLDARARAWRARPRSPRTSSARRSAIDRLVVGSAALGRALVRQAAGGAHVGSADAERGRARSWRSWGCRRSAVVPCLLNVSAGAAAMLSACRAAGVRTVISSRDLRGEGAALPRLVERMAEEVRFVWLEDVRDADRPAREAARQVGCLARAPAARARTSIRTRRRSCCSPAARRARRRASC